MALPTFLSSAIDAWAAAYDTHRMLSVSVRYLHLAGLVVGGGTALAADRRILRTATGGHSWPRGSSGPR